MHNLSFESVSNFVSKYYNGGSVLEIGGADVNGSVRRLFNGPYTTMDIAGSADIIVADPYVWAEILDESYDFVISTSCLEHVEYPWLTMCEVARVLKIGGITCHTVPSGGVEHKYPLDCYRIYPDGARALLKWAGLTDLGSYTNWQPVCVDDGGNQFKDTVIIGKKC